MTQRSRSAMRCPVRRRREFEPKDSVTQYNLHRAVPSRSTNCQSLFPARSSRDRPGGNINFATSPTSFLAATCRTPKRSLLRGVANEVRCRSGIRCICPGPSVDPPSYIPPVGVPSANSNNSYSQRRLVHCFLAKITGSIHNVGSHAHQTEEHCHEVVGCGVINGDACGYHVRVLRKYSELHHHIIKRAVFTPPILCVTDPHYHKH